MKVIAHTLKLPKEHICFFLTNMKFKFQNKTFKRRKFHLVQDLKGNCLKVSFEFGHFEKGVPRFMFDYNYDPGLGVYHLYMKALRSEDKTNAYLKQLKENLSSIFEQNPCPCSNCIHKYKYDLIGECNKTWSQRFLDVKIKY